MKHTLQSGHKGRWLAGGMVTIAVGSFICAMPQFVSKAYSGYQINNTTEEQLCQSQLVDEHQLLSS